VRLGTERWTIDERKPIASTHPLPKMQSIAAKSMQYALYICMILIPVTGILTAQQHELPVNAFGSFNISAASVGTYNEAAFLSMRSIHSMAVNGFMFLLLGHIGAALFHGFIKKDGVLKSMLFSRKKASSQAKQRSKTSA
jgi:cytochrome b561